MLRSMTGFGRGIVETTFGRFLVDIQSVNRKYLEIQMSLPRELQRFEMDIRKWLGESISRGQITLRINASYYRQGPLAVKPNLALAKELKEAWEVIADELHQPQNQRFHLGLLANHIQDLMVYEEDWSEEELYKETLKQAVEVARQSLIHMKEIEGKALQTDISQRLQELLDLVQKIEVLAPEAAEKQKQKLQQKVLEWAPAIEEHEDRIMREIILYTDKADISEEITRFRSHIQQCQGLLSSAELSVGKKFEFLLQELGREANTMGSKSSDSSISHLVIEIKSMLEKIREQIQNVE